MNAEQKDCQEDHGLLDIDLTQTKSTFSTARFLLENTAAKEQAENAPAASLRTITLVSARKPHPRHQEKKPAPIQSLFLVALRPLRRLLRHLRGRRQYS